ncbi:hypothetical protein K493DRAFT_308618 [Basidiobolus meristosporus CBS 931.73]|uniref:Uncharacterized protein n=1 Tax=Basidiobolus meristosporus CBS 931.73 TaxID=1314790 RepID=A0A1Y1WZX7_9FUNG|nr:hypothetical protein K493DRAFT_308618 [Basidiobolus meristosporus CBS 931.73]|eukprot:ORX78945.1 hypothetical protein K493DRAFT_308618 [Basidiobolus meristosporus CBS 931.73]
MKAIVNVGVLLLFSASLRAATVDGFTLVNAFRQQAFDILQQVTNVYGKPKSHFADGIYNPDSKCRAVIQEIESKYPALNQCYSQLPLFFSTLNEVCDKKCFQDTIGAAQLISKSCASQSSSNSQRVYSSWSNAKAATVACRKDNGVYCLSRVIRASIALGNSLSRSVPPEELRKDICLPCTEDFYKTVKNPGEEPVLYYYQIMYSDQLFRAFEQHCGYHL